jgi:hypothetical protein
VPDAAGVPEPAPEPGVEDGVPPPLVHPVAARATASRTIVPRRSLRT